jgi:4-hydroxybenzoate polyprenyltransferase
VLLTQIAKRLGQRASVIVPLLIAGISILDGVIVAIAGGGLPLILLCVVCAVLTLGFQRVVPGT